MEMLQDAGFSAIEEDIKRRKKLALDAMSAFQEIWKCNQTNRSLKIRIFEALVKSNFLYNSEIWTMTPQ